MLLTGLLIMSVLLTLLIVLTMAERAYLQRHAAVQARDLLAVQAQASARGLMPDARDATPLLAETLDQDFFHEEASPPWWARQRPRGMNVRPSWSASPRQRPLSSLSPRRAGAASPEAGAGVPATKGSRSR